MEENGLSSPCSSPLSSPKRQPMDVDDAASGSHDSENEHSSPPPVSSGSGSTHIRQEGATPDRDKSVRRKTSNNSKSKKSRGVQSVRRKTSNNSKSKKSCGVQKGEVRGAYDDNYDRGRSYASEAEMKEKERKLEYTDMGCHVGSQCGIVWQPPTKPGTGDFAGCTVWIGTCCYHLGGACFIIEQKNSQTRFFPPTKLYTLFLYGKS